MGLWISARRALLRLVEDDAAGILQRVKALQQVEHPPLILLRRLLVESKTPRAKPVPAKLKAVATLKYAREIELRRMRKLQKRQDKTQGSVTNALGI